MRSQHRAGHASACPHSTSADISTVESLPLTPLAIYSNLAFLQRELTQAAKQEGPDRYFPFASVSLNA